MRGQSLDRVDANRRMEILAHVATRDSRRDQHDIVGGICYRCGLTEWHIMECRHGDKCSRDTNNQQQKEGA